MHQATGNVLKNTERQSRLLLIGLIALIVQALSTPPALAADPLPDAITFGVTVEQGDIAKVAEWLDAGLDPNFEGDRVGTGLMIAAWHGNIAMMELFVKRGADVNRANRFNEQALMHAVWKGRRVAAGWLVLHGASVNREGNEWSALHYATFAGHEELAKFLIQQKADVNAKSTNGSTVLMMAAHEGRQKIAALLIEAGAMRSTKNDLGEDALSWAMRYQNLTIAKMVTSEGEFTQAVTQPQANWGEAVATLAAPPAVENILQQERLAHASGKARVMSDDEYRKVLERIAAMKPPPVTTRPPKRMSITAEKRDQWREWAELKFDE